jgi:deazaflavin-dependent oxidoreductase (nitroreductase family)
MEPRIPKYVPVGNAAVKLFTRLGVKTGPVNVITVAGRRSGQPRSTPVTPWQVDGKRYVIAAIGTSDWARNARAAGEGILTSGRTTTRVRLTGVTDPALKERVVTAFGTENKAGGSFLVQAGVAPDRTPKGFAAALPHVAVFGVAPAQD